MAKRPGATSAAVPACLVEFLAALSTGDGNAAAINQKMDTECIQQQTQADTPCPKYKTILMG